MAAKFPVAQRNLQRNELVRVIRKHTYFVIKVRRIKGLERKQDARKKIMLGGLIIKAGLDYLHPEEAYVIYGMLLDCKKALATKPEIKERWKKLGKELLVGN